MTDHDTFKMTPAELESCGCERCRDALRMHAVLDQLVAASDQRMAALDRVEAGITRLETVLKEAP